MLRIQSTMNITVTPGLQCQDCTDKNALIPNKLNVKPEWAQAAVDIKEGVGYYPDEVAEWNTTKRLVELNVLTISKADEEKVPETDKEKVKEMKQNIKIMKERAN